MASARPCRLPQSGCLRRGLQPTQAEVVAPDHPQTAAHRAEFSSSVSICRSIDAPDAPRLASCSKRERVHRALAAGFMVRFAHPNTPQPIV